MTGLRHNPSAERNGEPIEAVLARVLPAGGVVLEVASGTGQHAVRMAGAFPGLTWQPTDVDPASLPSIAARVEAAGLPNLRPPALLDVQQPPETWPIGAADALVCINMLHIAPWTAALGLFRGAARLLGRGGVLYTYGPYRFDGEFTAPSNVEFDASLRARDPAWGVRDIRDLEEAALAVRLRLVEVVRMPVNNHSLVFHMEDV